MQIMLIKRDDKNVMLSINVNESKILIDNDLIIDIKKHISNEFLPCKVLIISDKNVEKLYFEKVKTDLINLKFKVTSFIFSPGEQSKTYRVISEIYKILSLNYMSRTDIVIALGGGIVTDIAGFVAATYNRGMNLINIPTSLLAQIDAAIGGKNGINSEFGKNLIGTFYQPNLILIDPRTLESLPETELSCGIAEAIKYGCIKDKELFKILEDRNFKDAKNEIIYRSIMVKKELVEEDKFDLGIRMLLNFGHTIGHALERLENYKNLSHGTAVAIGMNMITKISEKLELTEKGTADRLGYICKKYCLPTESNFSCKEIFEVILHDKKVLNDYLNLILLKRIGNGFIYKIHSKKFIDFMEGESLT